MDSAVERAIKCIWERYSEPLSLSDLACSAILSRFHFSRIFKDATGVSPGRFLSAVRIYQAKRMLLNTSLKVTDISFAVGFNSLGSFTNHFTASVGVSPGRFRRMSGNVAFEPLVQPLADPEANGVVTGAISIPRGFAWARVYLGTFTDPIMQCRPAAATIVEVPGSGEPRPYRLASVPDGTWFIHAVAVAETTDPEPWTMRTTLVGTSNLVSVSAGDTARAIIPLRSQRPTDLPILLALPDLDSELDSFAPDDMAEARAEESASDLA
jgi:AraC family transcriptional regulator